MKSAVIAVLAALLTSPVWAQEAPSPTPPAAPAATGPQAAFSGAIEVNLVNVFVTVTDGEGQPVTGLGRDRFVVFEQGERMEITNFAEISRGPAAAPAASGEAPLVDLAGGASPAPAAVETERLVVVFDNQSLEKRARKRAVKAVREFLAQRAPAGGEVMIALLAPEVENLSAFTADAATIDAALTALAETDAGGDLARSSKRMLVRDIATTEVGMAKRMVPTSPIMLPSGGSGGGSGGGTNPPPRPESSMPAVVFDDGAMSQQSVQLKARIEALRSHDYHRTRQTLLGLDSLARSLSGVGGRVEILCIGEDLAMRPTVDVYSIFFDRFQQWAAKLGIDPPGVWAQSADLTEEFKFVAAGAQAAGATLHFLDCADRDRDAATDEMGRRRNDQTLYAHGGATASGGYHFSRSADLVEGSRYLAGATGGTAFFNSRELDTYLASLGGRLGSYYSLAYRRPGAADGQLHAVTITLGGAGDGLTVHHHEKVLNRTPVQKLADETLSRLRLDVGFDDLHLRAEVGDAEPSASDASEQLVRGVRLFIPARNLVLAEEGSDQVGQLMVVLQSQGANGEVFPPQVMQLTIKVPTDRLTPATTTSASLRLMMRTDTARLAIGVADLASGAGSTALVDLPAKVAG